MARNVSRIFGALTNRQYQMKKIKNIDAALLLFMALSLFIACGGKGNDEPGSIALSGRWKIVETDDIAPAEADFDDSKAASITIPGKWDYVLERNRDLASTVWLRKKIIIPEDFTDQLMVLSLGTIAVVDETYFNGIYVGGTGRFPSGKGRLDYSIALHRERNYQFPSSLVRYGGENVIAIKVFSHYVNGMRSDPELLTLAEWNQRTRYAEFLPSFSNINGIIISFILFLFLAILVKGTVKMRFAVYSAVFIISVFVMILLLLGLPAFENNIDRFKLFFGIYAFIDYMLLLVIQEFFKIKFRFLTVYFSVLLAALIGFIAFAPDTSFLITYCSKATIFLVILYILYSTTIFMVALFRDPRRYWYLVFVATFILISVGNTLFTLVTNQMYKLSFTFALRLPALLLGAFFVYLFDLKNIKTERDSLAQALLRKSKELQRVTKMLSRFDVKPEPRDIIHDVIEYLDNNYNETYDRKKLAEKFRLNEDYMGQLFKKMTNTNIANYINIKRIEAAKQLLQETNSRVIDIAFHVGFDNLTYFYRHFKKHTGYSPVEYRRMVTGLLHSISSDEFDQY